MRNIRIWRTYSRWICFRYSTPKMWFYGEGGVPISVSNILSIVEWNECVKRTPSLSWSDAALCLCDVKLCSNLKILSQLLGIVFSLTSWMKPEFSPRIIIHLGYIVTEHREAALHWPGLGRPKLSLNCARLTRYGYIEIWNFTPTLLGLFSLGDGTSTQ